MVRKQNETNFVWFVAIAAMFVIVALRCFDSKLMTEPDATFLYNRAFQMWDCLRHGFWPFLYYNDVGGIGYASPIFYGQLTLLPFIPLLGSISSFIRGYFLVCVVLNFFGFRFLCKRFSSYATLSACFYVLGVPFVTLCGSGMYAFVLGLGFSWFFFGYCVDYFRDNRNLFPLVLFYFLIWQSNFNAVALATLVCFCLFCCYFRLSHWRAYVRLFLCVLLLVSYDIVNMLVHLDALRLSDFSLGFLGDMSKERIVMSTSPFGGFLYRSIQYVRYNGDLCCGFMSFGFFCAFTHYWVFYGRDKSMVMRVRAVAVWMISIVGYLAGIHTVWGHVFKATHAFFQFPIRYFILCYGFIVVVLAKVIKNTKFAHIVLILALLDIFITNPLSVGVSSGEMDFVFQRIVYAEYAGSNFVRGIETYDIYSSAVVSSSGREYSYVNDYNGLTVDCFGNVGDEVLTLPKLYYRGYKATGSGDETFVVRSGYSNYCEVDIGDYQGSLILRYETPKIVLAFFWLQVACLLAVLWNICFERDRRWHCFEGAKGK